MTPRVVLSAAWWTALAITSVSEVDSTCATVGAVRPHPVSRRGVVATSVVSIVNEGTVRSPRAFLADGAVREIAAPRPEVAALRCWSGQVGGGALLLSDIDSWNVSALQSIAVELGDELTTIEGVASDLELISRLPG